MASVWTTIRSMRLTQGDISGLYAKRLRRFCSSLQPVLGIFRGKGKGHRPRTLRVGETIRNWILIYTYWFENCPSHRINYAVSFLWVQTEFSLMKLSNPSNRWMGEFLKASFLSRFSSYPTDSQFKALSVRSCEGKLPFTNFHFKVIYIVTKWNL